MGLWVVQARIEPMPEWGAEGSPVAAVPGGAALPRAYAEWARAWSSAARTAATCAALHSSAEARGLSG